MSRVAIFQDDDIGMAIGQALAALEIEEVIRGKLVAVKPNETWASAEDTTAVTQGDTLSAVLRELKTRAPRQLVVSGGAGAAETAEVFRHSGMMSAVEDAGVEFVDHNQPPFVEVPLAYGPQPSVMVNPRVLEYGELVVVSQLKVHSQATVTMALKNLAMSYPAAGFYGYPRSEERHRHGFFSDLHGFIAGMAQRFPIDLAITVGHPAMVGTGPIGGHTFETGLVIASTDALAADVVGAKILGFELQGVRHLWEAAALNLGQSDIGKLEIAGLSLGEATDAFRSRAYAGR